jgi:hypothetical protein
VPINQEDVQVLTLRKEYTSDSDVTELIQELRNESIEYVVDQKISLLDCYPELTHDENELTMTIYGRQEYESVYRSQR